MTGQIKTGTTTWADRSLLASGWYPDHATTAATRLRYYATRFSVVENDSSYWALPERQRVEFWAGVTPPGFTMNMKAHALMTGHYTDPARLPGDIRAALARDKPRVYPRDVGLEHMREIQERFHRAIEPLHERGKLGVVLFQFPVWFPFSRTNRDQLALIRHQMAPYRVAVEFRNATWMSPHNRRKTLETLVAEDIVYTCVDEPQGFASSVPPFVAATSQLALVRMHGHNAARWEHGARTASERFRYRYSSEELRGWVPRILTLADQAPEVHVLFNNCYADYAVQNASELARLVERTRTAAATRPAA